MLASVGHGSSAARAVKFTRIRSPSLELTSQVSTMFGLETQLTVRASALPSSGCRSLKARSSASDWGVLHQRQRVPGRLPAISATAGGRTELAAATCGACSSAAASVMGRSFMEFSARAYLNAGIAVTAASAATRTGSPPRWVTQPWPAVVASPGTSAASTDDDCGFDSPTVTRALNPSLTPLRLSVCHCG